MKLALELAAFLIVFLCASTALREFLKLRFHLHRTPSTKPHEFPARSEAPRRKRAAA